ncbi:hypothetical protein CORC01_07592 [Colletotrichum orchidophilum]|uniref:Uncharacterized protein n=1 Tax=Colletotrichum orchidophilum TaxID=1209926 RepID=A0A1G4B6V6_9PEZI|nr:uncharacterized protein CORC01_07592 [Colletotrichum orchidophilum]OHE97151.1 hypothetical protein CORC01_07592 [Colletotrichum orchidophilum]
MDQQESVPLIRANAEAITVYLEHRRLIDRWGMYVSSLGVAAQFLEVLQGSRAQAALEAVGGRMADNAEAQTGLDAPSKFAKQVHRFVVQQTTCTRRWQSEGQLHVFFLYHPDTDWDPAFFHRIRDQPLSRRFFGISQNLDALVIWMSFIKENMARQRKEIHIHLLIPAYRPMMTGESLAFPDKLMPLTIHGHIHNSMPYVWLNLPQPSRRLQLSGVGNLTDLLRNEADNSNIPEVILGGVATAAAGAIAGIPAAIAVGSFFAGKANSGRIRPFVSDAHPRMLGEAPARDLDDDRSSDDDDDEKRQVRRRLV